MKASNKLYFGIAISIFFYLVGFIMIHSELWNPLTQAYTSLPDEVKIKLWGEFFFQSASLLLTIFVLKFLLGMEPFKNAIKDVFSEIFEDHKFLKSVDKESLLKIAKNITLANKDIDFIDSNKKEDMIRIAKKHFENLEKESLLKVAENIQSINHDILFINKSEDNESVEKLEKYLEENKEVNKDKNYIVVKSDYNTTLFSNGIEIMHRKIKCKIQEEGMFKFEYLFTPPDKSKTVDHTLYLNTKEEDRFTNRSYNSMLNSSITNDGLKIKEELSTGRIEEEDAISIIFTKKHTLVGETIDIEFSISHPFELIEEEDIKNYYNSTYAYPHAVRNIIFQIEKYKEQPSKIIPNASPVLYANNGKHIKANYSESIYYRTYAWEVFYSKNDSEKIEISIE